MLDGDNAPDTQVDPKEGQPADPEAASTSETPVRRRRSIFQDRTVRLMGAAALGLIILYLLVVIGALVSGLLGEGRPVQTSAERDLRMYSNMIQQGANTEDVWARYVDALIRTKQYGKAQQVIDQARRAKIVDPRRQLLAVSQVNLFIARKDWKQAVKAADTGMAALQKQYQADWTEYGKSKKPTVMTATGVGDNYYAMLYAKAKALEQLKQPNEAIAALDEYLKKKDTAADVFELRGDLRAASGEKEKALADYRAARVFLEDTKDIDAKIKGLGADK